MSALYGITREEALELISAHLPSENMKSHSLASEAIMRDLADKLGEDPELWGLTGLLHDLDYNQTKDQMNRHTLVTEVILRDKRVDDKIIDAIKRHNAENLGLTRTEPIHFALTAAETITGLLVAAALVNPERKITALKVKSVKKRMKAKEFARSVNRDHIRLCERLGLELDDFIDTSINAMAKIAPEIGL